MYLKTKAAAAVVLTAILMTGCGTAFEEDVLPVPTVDRVKSESVSVSAQDAVAAPAAPYTEVSSHEGAEDPAEEYESILTAPETVSEEINEGEGSAESERSYYDENGEKVGFDFKPEYDEEFFENDLFVGDSITTGFSGYGIIDEKNVYAKIGLNPLTALDTEIQVGEEKLTLEQELAAVQPEHVYIMLGSNGIEWITCSNMAESISGVIDAAKAASPDTQIVMLSVPPVTKDYDAANKDLDVMDKIREYNSILSELCAEKEVGFVDITTMLEDEEGYFVHYYAETDGMHFKPTAYKMVLSKIQYTLS